MPGRSSSIRRWKNPTLVVLTDRNDLDDQLFGTFSMCKDLLRQTPQQAEDREHLRKLLDRPSGGVIFTTLQKFSPEDGDDRLSGADRPTNVIVIADEAHRSQYGFRAKVETQDRRHLLRLRQVSARRPAERLLHRLYRHADREGRRQHAGRVRRLHRHLRHQPRGRGRRDRADLLREPAGAHRTRRRREAEDRRRDRRPDRRRGRRANRSGSSANGRASRRWSAPTSASPWLPKTS